MSVIGDLPRNFHLYLLLDGMVRVAELHETPYCGWCDQRAAVMLPRDHWDPTSPLTQPACVKHGGLDQLFDTADGSSEVWTQYLSVFEREDA